MDRSASDLRQAWVTVGSDAGRATLGSLVRPRPVLVQVCAMAGCQRNKTQAANATATAYDKRRLRPVTPSLGISPNGHNNGKEDGLIHGYNGNGIHDILTF